SAVWAGVLLLSRGFCFRAGYHRCLAHRSYRTGRVLQLVLAAGGGAALRGGPLWWAGPHRHHHRFADTDVDVHSPATGLWWRYGGGLRRGPFAQPPSALAKDLAAVPELRWLNRHGLVPPALLGLAVRVAGGWEAFALGFCLPSALLRHGLGLADALAH